MGHDIDLRVLASTCGSGHRLVDDDIDLWFMDVGVITLICETCH